MGCRIAQLVCEVLETKDLACWIRPSRDSRPMRWGTEDGVPPCEPHHVFLRFEEFA